MRSKSIFVAAIIVFSAANPYACDPVFAGYLYGGEVTGGDLYRINPDGGSWEIVTHSLPHSTGGLAYNTNDGYLYGGEVTGGDLYRINPVDGAWVIVTHSLPHSTGGLAIPEPSTLLLLGLGGMILRRIK